MEALGSYQEVIENEISIFQETQKDNFGKNQENALMKIKIPKIPLSAEKEATFTNSETFPSSSTEEQIMVSKTSNQEVRFNLAMRID